LIEYLPPAGKASRTNGVSGAGTVTLVKHEGAIGLAESASRMSEALAVHAAVPWISSSPFTISTNARRKFSAVDSSTAMSGNA
jgi:hypothetical protein